MAKKKEVRDSMQGPMAKNSGNTGKRNKKGGKKKQRNNAGSNGTKRNVLWAKLGNTVRGCVDPFSDCAVGCKVIGSDTSRTFTYSAIGRNVVYSQASGYGAGWYSPGLQSTLGYANTIVGTNVTAWIANNLPEYASMETVASKYRVVCAGVHVFASASTDKSQGVIQVSSTSGDQGGIPSPLAPFAMESMIYEECDTGPVFGFDRYYTFRRRNNAEVHEFENTLSSVPHRGWNDIYISVSGCEPSAAICHVEYFYHFELQPDPITIGARIADPPKPSPPGLEHAIQNAAKMVPFGAPVESWEEKIMDVIKSPLTWEIGGAILGGLL